MRVSHENKRLFNPLYGGEKGKGRGDRMEFSGGEKARGWGSGG
jgi:hypothetical protein